MAQTPTEPMDEGYYTEQNDALSASKTGSKNRSDAFRLHASPALPNCLDSPIHFFCGLARRLGQLAVALFSKGLQVWHFSEVNRMPAMAVNIGHS
jgi:hypothetical protein